MKHAAADPARSARTGYPADRVLIRGLEIRCVIGTFPHERVKKQSIFLDLDLPCDAARPARRDDLREALDYDRLTRRLREFAAGTKFFLIETFADRAAALLLKEFGLSEVRVTVWKPGAIKDCGNVGISIVRRPGLAGPAAGPSRQRRSPR
jgi:dihydroneopterin aldolase